ncbi:hypothetical protein BKA70DRAFT_1241079 [Coprinopsis sp. MPI-PUGE-AT-0042]|nr:hypothetical protein BKA70DRAFT_1241079 [Coprinopsis sp. MPI-PUGE-AT-0042]
MAEGFGSGPEARECSGTRDMGWKRAEASRSSVARRQRQGDGVEQRWDGWGTDEVQPASGSGGVVAYDSDEETDIRSEANGSDEEMDNQSEANSIDGELAKLFSSDPETLSDPAAVFDDDILTTDESLEAGRVEDGDPPGEDMQSPPLMPPRKLRPRKAPPKQEPPTLGPQTRPPKRIAKELLNCLTIKTCQPALPRRRNGEKHRLGVST